MVTYIQIGKNPRTAINDTPANIRADFIRQMSSWKTLTPIYFYSSKSAEKYTSVLLPKRIGGWITEFYMLTPNECWEFLNPSKKQTVPWYRIGPVVEQYRAKGYKI